MDPRRLLYLLLMLQARAQSQQGGQAKNGRGVAGGNQPTSIEQLINYAKKGWGAYNTGNDLYNAGTAAANYFAAPAANAATQAAWNAGAGEASQAAWNAGANAASEGANAASEGANAAGGSAPDTGGYVAAAMSAYNSGKAMFDKNLSDEDKAYEAALAGPRAVAAFYTAGLSTMAEGFARKQWGGTMNKIDGVIKKTSPFMQASKMWTSDKWKTEGNRLKRLVDRGIDIPEEWSAPMYRPWGGGNKNKINPNLPIDFVGESPQYGWTNNKHANSRDDKDLVGKDIWGYSAFFDKYGNDWLKFSGPQREAIANKALQRGTVKEHHGTIDINWTPELEADVATIAQQQPPQPQPQEQRPSRYDLKNGKLVLRNASPRSNRKNNATN